MTTFNTDYNNTELLDQELTTAELSEVSGGEERWHSDDFSYNDGTLIPRSTNRDVISDRWRAALRDPSFLSSLKWDS